MTIQFVRNGLPFWTIWLNNLAAMWFWLHIALGVILLQMGGYDNLPGKSCIADCSF